jgi:hypothetical protein
LTEISPREGERRINVAAMKQAGTTTMKRKRGARKMAPIKEKEKSQRCRERNMPAHSSSTTR